MVKQILIGITLLLGSWFWEANCFAISVEVAEPPSVLSDELSAILPPGVPPSSVLILDPEAQSWFENYVAKLYEQIKIAGDSETPPRIVLMNLQGDDAFVIPERSKKHIFWNASSFLRSGFIEEDAIVLAHELEHLTPDQERRYSYDGHFANEVEAQIKGVATRVLKVGQRNSKGNLVSSPFHPDTIIALHGLGSYSDTHINPRDAQAFLTMLYGRERSSRQYASAPTAKTIPDRVRAEISKELKQTSSFRRKENKDTKLRKDIHNMVKSALSTTPLSELDKAARHLAQAIRKHDVDQIEIALREVDNAADILIEPDYHKLDSLAPLSDIAQLRPTLFQDLQRDFTAARALTSGIIYYNLHELAKVEAFFNELRLAQSSGSNAPHFPFDIFAEAWLPAFTWRYLQAGIDRNFELILRLAERDFETMLPFFGLAQSHAFLFDLDQHIKLERKFISHAARLDVQKIITGINEGRTPPAEIAAFDKWGERLNKAHALPQELRRALLNKFNEHIHLDMRRQLARGDRNLVMEQLNRLHPVSDFASYMALFSEATRFMDNQAVDALFSTAIRNKMSHIPALIKPDKQNEVQHFLDATPNAPPASIIRLLEPSVIAGLTGYHTLTQRDLEQAAALDSLIDWSVLAKAGTVSGTPFSAIHDDYNTLTDQTLDWINDIWVMREAIEQSGRSFDTQYPQVIAAAEEMISKRPHHYVTLLREQSRVRQLAEANMKRKKEAYLSPADPYQTLNWDRIISRMDIPRFLSLLAAPPLGIDQRRSEAILSACYKRLATLVGEGQLNEDELRFALTKIVELFPAWTPEASGVLHAFRTRVLNEGLYLLETLPPVLFESQQAYINYVCDLVRTFADERQLDNPQSRLTYLEKIISLIKRCTPTDHLLRAALLDHLAEDFAARPGERGLFEVKIENAEANITSSLRTINAILSAYSSLKPQDRWDLLQWIRGKKTSFSERIRLKIRHHLIEQGIFIPLQQLEAYLRLRFDGLTPLSRGAFFLVALNGQNGLLSIPFWRSRIQAEFFDSIPQAIRPIAGELYEGVLHTLPASLRPLLLAIAFCESGRHGSPESALRMIFSRQGLLVQKFGQTLALDPNMAPSFRAELQKLWDEVNPPRWWEAYDLLTRQYGDIGSAGFRMKRIRNGGTTEIFIELEGPEGPRMVSVYREGLPVSLQVDEKDLRALVNFLVQHYDADKYGFLELLVEDSIRTARQELDFSHKRRMNSEMALAYKRAALDLGGTLQTSGKTNLAGWTISSVDYVDYPLKDGKILVTQSVAPGVPLKSLEQTDPELYKEVTSTVLIPLENHVQSDAGAPIDKDRMPGQYFIDVDNRIITMLDPGQARFIDAEARRARNPFISAALSNNARTIISVTSRLGFDLPSSSFSALHDLLKGTPVSLRPLQALNWIWQNRSTKAEHDDRFFDLVQAVRAKVRLLQWDEMLGNSTMRAEWKTLYLGGTRSRATSAIRSAFERCKGWLRKAIRATSN